MTDLLPVEVTQTFGLAERIARTSLIPSHYRGKPDDIAVAILYGAEMGLPPMTALHRVVVVEGKPTLDAQGMVALIRQAGHSLGGEMSPTKAVAEGKRRDTGDEMTVTWTIEHAKQIGLANKKVWKDYPEAMLWARAVSQLARALFADVLLGVSYTPEEAQSIIDEQPKEKPKTTRRAAPRAEVAPESVTEDGEIVDAEVVDEPLESQEESAGGDDAALDPSDAKPGASTPADKLRVNEEQSSYLIGLMNQVENAAARRKIKRVFADAFGAPGLLLASQYDAAADWVAEEVGKAGE